MNIYIMLIILSVLDDAAVLPTGRGALRHQRDRAIAHNRAVCKSLIHGSIWYDEKYHDYAHTRVKHPEWEGKYVGYHGSKVTDKSQRGRWATERLSGHRRFQKWSRDYYPSATDEFARRRWAEELKEFFEE
jgi:hypothetical protein